MTDSKWAKLGDILKKYRFENEILGEFPLEKNRPYELIDATRFLHNKHVGDQKNLVRLPRILLQHRPEAQFAKRFYSKHHSGRIEQVDETAILKHYRMIDGAIDKIHSLLNYEGVPYPIAVQINRRPLRFEDMARKRETQYLFTAWRYGVLTEFRSLLENKEGKWMYHDDMGSPSIITTHDGKSHLECIEIGWHRYHDQHRDYDEPAHVYLHNGKIVKEEYRTNGLLHRTCGPAYITRDVFRVDGVWGVQGEKLEGFVPGPDFDTDQTDRDNTIIAYIKANPKHIKRMLTLCEHNKWLSRQAMDSLLAAAMFMK